jgi:hypothetical protein
MLERDATKRPAGCVQIDDALPGTNAPAARTAARRDPHAHSLEQDGAASGRQRAPVHHHAKP